MVIARTRTVWSFSPWLTMLLGVALFIVAGLNLNYDDVKAAPLVWLLAVCFLLLILFVLPIRNIGAYQEVVVEGFSLKLRKQPSNKVAEYDLNTLVKWQLKGPSGKYDYGNNLFLIFNNGSRFNISEMEYNNFDSLVDYFDKAFKTRKS